METREIRITLDLQVAGGVLSGTAYTADAEHAFHGWLGMCCALDDLLPGEVLGDEPPSAA